MPERKLDDELSLRGIIGFGITLALVMIGVTALMWWLSLRLRAVTTANDAPLPALLEARSQELPPEPRLQTDPIGDLGTLRAQEELNLGSAAWIDREAGIARIPITDAMEIVAARGELPEPAASQPASGFPTAGEERK